MSTRYSPGPASGARIDKHGARWTLVLVRDLRHPPERVWPALTEPEHLREWAPFDADRSLGTPGTAKLSTVGAPTPMVAESRVTRADQPRVLEFTWGPQHLRWELEPRDDGGTRLTLWHDIEQNFIAMGAAGWHVCFDVLAHLLDGDPLGRIVGPDAMKFEGWKRLHAEYRAQFAADEKGTS
jgi:uncharacterized protein YndB with AHSA1/START domain